MGRALLRLSFLQGELPPPDPNDLGGGDGEEGGGEGWHAMEQGQEEEEEMGHHGVSDQYLNRIISQVGGGGGWMGV